MPARKGMGKKYQINVGKIMYKHLTAVAGCVIVAQSGMKWDERDSPDIRLASSHPRETSRF